MVLPDRRDGTLYAALNLGHFGAKLHRRDAGSSDWVEVAAPAFPVKPADSTDPVEWTVRQIWSLAAGGRTSRACCGPAPAGRPVPLGDRGDSWQLVDALWKVPERAQWMGGGYDVPGIHSICVDPRDSGRCWWGSCGGAWLTTDGGASWQRARACRPLHAARVAAGAGSAGPAPHRALRGRAGQAVVPASQRHLAQRRQWRQLTEVAGGAGPTLALTGRASAGWRDGLVRAGRGRQPAHPAAGRAGGHATTDGGSSFVAWRGGLPHQHCYDLVYRHGLAVSDDGQMLLMGSTTGGAWLSEDGGGQWQTISTTLPPIYAVAFAPSRPRRNISTVASPPGAARPCPARLAHGHLRPERKGLERPCSICEAMSGSALLNLPSARAARSQLVTASSFTLSRATISCARCGEWMASAMATRARSRK
jgi:hypothetical protein